MADGLSSRPPGRLGGRHEHRHAHRRHYRLRILACLAASLLLLIAAVRLWPVSPAPSSTDVEAQVYDHVDLREVTQTRHAKRAAPPPPPPPPPLYETDDLIEQEPLDLTVELAPAKSSNDAPPGPKSTRDGEAKRSASVAPDVGARQLRIPEPHYTERARRAGIRARLEVEVVITATGRVERAQIVGRTLLASEDTPSARAVSSLGYGLEAAALDAARRTLFRPARVGGEAVKSRKTLTLTFGPGEG